MTRTDLSRRIPIALVGAPLVLGSTFLGGIPFLLLVLALTVRGEWELTRLFEPERGYGAIRTLSIICGAALILDAWHLAARHWTWILLAGIILSIGEGMSGIWAGLLVLGACVSWGLDNHFTALIDGITPSQSTLHGAQASD